MVHDSQFTVHGSRFAEREKGGWEAGKEKEKYERDTHTGTGERRRRGRARGETDTGRREGAQ